MHCFHLSQGKGKQLQPTENKINHSTVVKYQYPVLQFHNYLVVLYLNPHPDTSTPDIQLSWKMRLSFFYSLDQGLAPPNQSESGNIQYMVLVGCHLMITVKCWFSSN